MVNVPPRYWRKKLLLVKLESSEGEDPTPTTNANSILAQNVQFTPLDGEYITRNLQTGRLGAQPRVPVGMHASLAFEVELQGRGSTQSAVPAWGPLLRACRMSQTVSSDPSIQASPATMVGAPTGRFTYVQDAAYAGTTPRRVTLTCTTGGGTGVAEFTVAAAAGFGVNAASATGQVMTNATEFALVGGATITPTITTGFQVGDKFTIDLLPAHVAYDPNDDVGESAYAYLYIDGHRHKIGSLRGNVAFVYENKNFPKLRFNMKGTFVDPTATAMATGDFSAWQTPRTLSPAYVPFFNLHEYEAAVRSLTIDVGNQLAFRSLINQEKTSLGDREGSAKISILSPVLSTKNFFDIAKNQTLGRADLWHGTAAGFITAVSLPELQLTKPQEVEDQGEAMLEMDGHMLTVSAADDVVLRVM